MLCRFSTPAHPASPPVDTLGRTVLHMCGTDPQSSSKAVIDVSCARIAKLLIGAGFDGDRRCDEGWRPVDVYAALGLPETVAVLVASGVVVNTWDYVYGRSPLMRAAMNGMKTTVKVLVEGGAKVDYRSGDGSAVTVAVRNEVMGKINMPPKATPSETTSETTPRASSSHDWDEFVERQEATFADTCDPTARGTQDVVDYGCEPGKEYFAIVDYLLAAGADPNFPEEATGRTPIMMASKAGHERLVARLLETEKVDLQIADKDGFGAITYAETDEIRDMLVDYLVRTIN